MTDHRRHVGGMVTSGAADFTVPETDCGTAEARRRRQRQGSDHDGEHGTRSRSRRGGGGGERLAEDASDGRGHEGTSLGHGRCSASEVESAQKLSTKRCRTQLIRVLPLATPVGLTPRQREVRTDPAPTTDGDPQPLSSARRVEPEAVRHGSRPITSSKPSLSKSPGRTRRRTMSDPVPARNGVIQPSAPEAG